MNGVMGPNERAGVMTADTQAHGVALQSQSPPRITGVTGAAMRVQPRLQWRDLMQTLRPGSLWWTTP